MAKTRNYCWTLNNYTQEDILSISAWDCKYIVFGKEIGEQGTPHLQGYVEFENPRTIKGLKKLNPRIHWEARRGTAKQAREYCIKENDFTEKGKISQQGERKDLNELKDDIMDGKTSVDNIAINSPETYHKYGRTLAKLEDLAMRKKFRTEMTAGIWLWGSTGVGKTHTALKDFHPDTHYILPNDNGWWDGYAQQETVVLNDFRGEIPYNQLLQMVDKWPFSVRRRSREPLPFTSKRVIITSSLPPHKIYHNRDTEDNIKQLLRRFEIIKLEQKYSEGNTETSEPDEITEDDELDKILGTED